MQGDAGGPTPSKPHEKIPGHQRHSYGNGTPSSHHSQEKSSLMARERVWLEVERRAALEKVQLLSRYWNEEAVSRQGAGLKARNSRVRAVNARKDFDEETQKGLLAGLEKADGNMEPKIQQLEVDQINQHFSPERSCCVEER